MDNNDYRFNPSKEDLDIADITNAIAVIIGGVYNLRRWRYWRCWRCWRGK